MSRRATAPPHLRGCSEHAWQLAVIEAACATLALEKLERLKTLKDALPPEISYDEIRLVLARLRRARRQKRAEIPA